MTQTQSRKKNLFQMNVDLMHGPIFRSLVLFMLPILISNLFQQLYNTVDTMIVGNVLGDTALAAIGSCGAIYELLVGFGLGIGNGLAIVAARAYGAQDEDLLKRTVAGSLVIGLVASLTITAAGFFGQLGAVILSQSFHQALNDDALGTGDVALGGIEDLHTVVPELFLIDGAVVAVAGQTVGFPADHGVKGVRRTVGHQLLEGGAVIGFAADVAVYILAQDGHAVGAGVGLTVPALALDALLGLAAAAGVAVVSHQARCIGCGGFFAGHDNTSFRAVAHMQGAWYTDPCKHKIFFVRFCAALHVIPGAASYQRRGFYLPISKKRAML